MNVNDESKSQLATTVVRNAYHILVTTDLFYIMYTEEAHEYLHLPFSFVLCWYSNIYFFTFSVIHSIFT